MAPVQDRKSNRPVRNCGPKLAGGLDQRARALGEQLAASPEPWLAKRLGVLAPHASPLLRDDCARRAPAAAVYREAAGITDPAAHPHL